MRWSIASTALTSGAARHKRLNVPAPAGDSRGVERFFDGKTFDPANPGAYLASLAIKSMT